MPILIPGETRVLSFVSPESIANELELEVETKVYRVQWKIRGLGETLAKQLQKAAKRRREKRRRICVQKVRGIWRKVLSEVEKEICGS